MATAAPDTDPMVRDGVTPVTVHGGVVGGGGGWHLHGFFGLLFFGRSSTAQPTMGCYSRPTKLSGAAALRTTYSMIQHLR